MGLKNVDNSKTGKPAGKAEQQAASESTKDGLKTGRENKPTRDEVLEQKTSQGQPNRG